MFGRIFLAILIFLGPIIFWAFAAFPYLAGEVLALSVISAVLGSAVGALMFTMNRMSGWMLVISIVLAGVIPFGTMLFGQEPSPTTSGGSGGGPAAAATTPVYPTNRYTAQEKRAVVSEFMHDPSGFGWRKSPEAVTQTFDGSKMRWQYVLNTAFAGSGHFQRKGGESRAVELSGDWRHSTYPVGPSEPLYAGQDELGAVLYAQPDDEYTGPCTYTCQVSREESHIVIRTERRCRSHDPVPWGLVPVAENLPHRLRRNIKTELAVVFLGPDKDMMPETLTGASQHLLWFGNVVTAPDVAVLTSSPPMDTDLWCSGREHYLTVRPDLPAGTRIYVRTPWDGIVLVNWRISIVH